MNLDQIKIELSRLGDFSYKKKSGRHIQILTDEPRVPLLKKVATIIDGVYDPNFGASSVGCVLVGNVKIGAAPLKRQGGFSTRDQSAALDKLNTEVYEFKGSDPYLNVYIGSVSYRISEFVNTPGTPKSDFHGVDDKGDQVCWISHKKGTKPSNYQQWGGISTKEYSERSAEIESFISTLKVTYSDGLPRGSACYRYITDKKLMKQSIYGKDYPGNCGINNVTAVIQGTPKIVMHEQSYALTTEPGGHILLNDTLPDERYMPTLMAMYRSDRNDGGVNKTRIGIWPRDGRKGTPI